jgi:hypothetical protein
MILYIITCKYKVWANDPLHRLRALRSPVLEELAHSPCCGILLLNKHYFGKKNMTSTRESSDIVPISTTLSSNLFVIFLRMCWISYPNCLQAPLLCVHKEHRKSGPFYFGQIIHIIFLGNVLTELSKLSASSFILYIRTHRKAPLLILCVKMLNGTIEEVETCTSGWQWHGTLYNLTIYG